MAEIVAQKNAENKKDIKSLTTFREIRLLSSSAVCLIMAYFLMRQTLSGSANDNLLFQILTYIMSVGMCYCCFGIGHWIDRFFFRKELIQKGKVLNYIVDTLIYLCLSVGTFFLLEFLLNEINWLGWLAILFCIGGVFQVVYDIHYISKLEIR